MMFILIVIVAEMKNVRVILFRNGAARIDFGISIGERSMTMVLKLKGRL